MLLNEYKNGNATIQLYSDGTRIVSANGPLQLEYPLNIDIRLSEKCAFGLNPKTGKAICDFCHESATTDGASADFPALQNVLTGLPAGIELAIGLNQIDQPTINFLEWCSTQGFVCNCTINQGHLRRDHKALQMLLQSRLVYGLGVSYRKDMIEPSRAVLILPNMVMHVIAGIDAIEEVKNLSKIGVKKILVLGEKDFGFNLGKVKIKSESHFKWYRQVHELFSLFDVVSFDNLALEQLNVRRFVRDWDTMYQFEHSMYINAVGKYFSPSSRSPQKMGYDIGIKDYFRSLYV